MSIFNEAHRAFLAAVIKNKVEFVLVGGYAVILHGGNRTTSDIDLLIRPSKENGQKLLDTFMELGLETEDISPSDFEEELYLSFGFEPEAVDVMTFTKGITFEEAYLNSKELKVDGYLLKLIDIRDLIRNKENLGRQGSKAILDQYDVAELTRIMNEKSTS